MTAFMFWTTLPVILVTLGGLLGFWFIVAQTAGLKMHEMPTAVMAWLAGGSTRRRLKMILAMRADAQRTPLPPRMEPGAAASQATAELKALNRKYPVTGRLLADAAAWQAEFRAAAELHRRAIVSRDELRAALSGPPVVVGTDWELKRLAVPGEPACDDPSCVGCQALAARRRHDKGCAPGALCDRGPHVRTAGGWAGQ